MNHRICPHCGTKNELTTIDCVKCNRRFDLRMPSAGHRIVSAQATQMLGQVQLPPRDEQPLPTAHLVFPNTAANTPPRAITPPRGSSAVPARSVTPPRGSASVTPHSGKSVPRIQAVSNPLQTQAGTSAPRMPAVSTPLPPHQSAPRMPAVSNPITPQGGHSERSAPRLAAVPGPMVTPASPSIPVSPISVPAVHVQPQPYLGPSGGYSQVPLDELSQLSPDELNSRNIIIGNYKLTRLLGQGGMGAVYLGEHIEIGKRAAVKILKPELAKDRESIARFLSEARLITRLRHPSIVDVYDCGVVPKVGRYLIMEFLEGDDLYAHLKKRIALSPAEAASIGWQILDALEAAHEAGVIHRDLKPPNIYLVRWGRRTLVKLLDFGVAKLLDTSKEDALLTRTGVVVGTPAYMAPEQAAGGKEPDGRLDLYSFGVIMFELVTGRRPFLSNNVNEILVMQQVEPAPMPSAFAPGLPKPFEQLILRCLEKSPADRPANARALKEELGAMMSGLPTVPIALEALKNNPRTGPISFPEVNTADIAPLLAPDEPVFGKPNTPKELKAKEDSKDLHAVLSSSTGLSSTAQRLKAAGVQPQKQSISNSFKELQALRAQATGDSATALAKMSAAELDAVAKYGATVAVRSPTAARRRLKSLVLVALIIGTVSFLGLLGVGGYFLWSLLKPPQPNQNPTQNPVAIQQPLNTPSEPQAPMLQKVVLDSVPRGADIIDADGKLIDKTPFTLLVPKEGLDVRLKLDKYVGTTVQLRQPSQPRITIELIRDVAPEELKNK